MPSPNWIDIYKTWFQIRFSSNSINYSRQGEKEAKEANWTSTRNKTQARRSLRFQFNWRIVVLQTVRHAPRGQTGPCDVLRFNLQSEISISLSLSVSFLSATEPALDNERKKLQLEQTRRCNERDERRQLNSRQCNGQEQPNGYWPVQSHCALPRVNNGTAQQLVADTKLPLEATGTRRIH